MHVAVKESSRADSRTSRVAWLAAGAAITGSALGLRFVNLGAKSLWLDETYRIYLARLDWHDFLRAAVRPFGVNSVAYHLVLRYWSVLGTGVVTLRVLSVLFGVALVLGIWKLGREWLDAPTGLIAAALASANALLITYSQDVCAYTPAALLAVLSSLYLLRAIKTDERRNWVLYVITAAAMLYCHVLSFLVVAAQVCALLLARKVRLGARAMLAVVGVGAASIPLAWCVAFASPRPKVWLLPPGLHELRLFLMAFGGPDGLLLGGLVLLLALLAIQYAVSEEMAAGWQSCRYTLLLLWAFVPTFGLFLLSQWRPLFHIRYLLPSVPPLLLLAATAVRRLKYRWLAGACVAIMLLLSVRGSILYLHHRLNPEHTDDWRDAAAYVVREARAGDAVVVYFHHERFPFQYYRDRFAGSTFPAQVFPIGSDEAVLEEADPIQRSVPTKEARPYARIWLLYSDSLASTEYAPRSDLLKYRELMAESFQSKSEKHFGNIHLTLFAGPRATPK